ncbi:MAG: Rieske 2Fe-2S domain-containing protein [Alphaproteobacteria bacterium]|nr:Rieske 2Fe-2S domain-containing protein [Alphaproteobacteria bacterium]
MLSAAENELLARVEGNAPMGQMMRRYWIAACLSEELAEPDCDPVRVKLLGENLVAFRDSDGRIGLLEESCPHRRASLFFGRNEECGLRCLYHGWKFDVEGRAVELASEPQGTGLAEKIRAKAYPVIEWGGVVWTYMGPAELKPEFLPPYFAPTPHTRVSLVKVHVDCNWAQGLEGAIDSAHSSSLHSTDMPPAMVGRSTATGTAWQRPSTDKSPRLQVQSTEYGFRYAAIRRPIKDAATHDYVRVTHFVAPHHVLIPPNDVYNVSQMNVPCDDNSHMLYLIAWSETGGVDQESWRQFTAMQVGGDLTADYRRKNGRDIDYGQDRKAMRLGSFTGIRGFPHQDIAMWETMGSIAHRDQERLAASDLAVVEFRRGMVEFLKAFAKGALPPAALLSADERRQLRAFEGIVAKETDWRTLGIAAPPARAAE